MTNKVNIREIIENAGADHNAPEGSQGWALAQVLDVAIRAIALARLADFDIQGVLADCDMRAEKANSLNQLLRDIRALNNQVQL